MYKWIGQLLLSVSLGSVFFGVSSVSVIAKATNQSIWDRDLAECKANRRSTEAPAKESREIHIEKHNISFKIPSNYRTRSVLSNTLSYVTVDEPSEFNYWECLIRKQAPTEGPPPPLIIKIENIEGEKSLIEIIRKRYIGHRRYRENSIEQISEFRTRIGIQKVLKYQYTSAYHDQQYQSIIFFLPGKKNFIEISNIPRSEDINWEKISEEIVASLGPIKDSRNATPNLPAPPRSSDKPVAIQQKPPSIRLRDTSINPPSSTVSQRPSVQEIALINQQTRDQQNNSQFNQTQRQARQTLQQQTSKYLAPFVGGWRTADNQTIFVYPSVRKGKERQACIITEKGDTQY
jgi:hypothetical protein